MFLITSLVALATAGTSMPQLTLLEVLRQARDNNPQVLAADAQVIAQDAQTKIPRALWYPNAAALIEAIGATTNNSTATVLTNASVDLPRIGATAISNNSSWGPNATTLGAVGVRQQLFDFGRISSQSSAADKALEAERAHADGVARDAVFYAAMAYYDVLGARAVTQTSAQAVERARALLAFVVAGIDRGLRPQIERLRMEADLQRFEAQRIRSLGALTNARANLAAAIGAQALEVDVVDDAPEFLGCDARTPTVVEATERAEPTDPELREARLRADAQHENARAARTQAYPNLYLTGALSARNGGAEPSSGDATSGNGFVPSVQNWSVGLIFQIPIFDASVNAKVDAAEAGERALRKRAEAVRIGVVTSAAQTVRNLAVAHEALPALERARDAAQGNYAQADARYKAGLGTSVELADAEALRVDAEIQQVLGAHAVARARLAVLRALSEDMTQIEARP
ncbi:MAG: TolC family protein [Clostridia bacterium]|nr:TolC family protein [Deltaproteobacteria bacterium]